MKVDLSSINEKDFLVSERQVCGTKAFLVCPTKGKHEWVDGEFHLRSILCDSDGEIICSGFPKFFNFGEKPKLDSLTRIGVLAGNSVLSSKMDGSLIIRSVINGQVSFRTRGSHNLGEFKDSVISIVKDKYPMLLDSNLDLGYNVSLLFEYVSPDNRIILSYDESDLYFLGGMILYPDSYPKFFPPSHFKSLVELLSLKVPGHYSLGFDVDVIRGEVSTWSGLEGIVVGVPLDDGSYLLSKLKTAEYINLHALRYHLSDSRVEQICWAADVLDEDSLKNIMVGLGLDWELTTFISKPFQEYMIKRTEVEIEIAAFLNSIEAEGIGSLESKKEKALALKDLCDEDSKLFGIGITYLTGSKERFEEMLLGYKIGISPKSVRSYLKEGLSILNGSVSRDGI